MIEFVKGEISDLTPTSVVLETAGVGYFLNISVNTFSEIQHKDACRLYVHEAIREDAYVLFGFFSTEEREAFRKLISVSGVGANTARVILSSLTVPELESGILAENLAIFKNIKGIGTKTAQRIIVELKDKVAKGGLSGAEAASLLTAGNEVRSEALAALQMLGFPAAASGKAINTVLKNDPSLTVEQLIKAALKLL
ncbi:MAG: Holliday junction branch migration protein RuvA [Bacteroidales bacterium]|nr:Holliday junction branch migration protein RuvA [Bacteroidales bacterium]